MVAGDLVPPLERYGVAILNLGAFPNENQRGFRCKGGLNHYLLIENEIGYIIPRPRIPL
jgi:hypothetical protein